MLRHLLVLSLISLVLIGIAGCKDRKANKIILEGTEVIEEAIETEKKLSEEKTLQIAVGSMLTPREGYAYYKQLLDYIGETIGKPVKFVDRNEYAEVNYLLKTGSLDFAFLSWRE